MTLLRSVTLSHCYHFSKTLVVITAPARATAPICPYMTRLGSHGGAILATSCACPSFFRLPVGNRGLAVRCFCDPAHQLVPLDYHHGMGSHTVEAGQGNICRPARYESGEACEDETETKPHLQRYQAFFMRGARFRQPSRTFCIDMRLWTNIIVAN
jgi:hypothetical protein